MPSRCAGQRAAVTWVGVFFVFRNYNLEQAAGIPGAQASRWTVSELTYYARIMPPVVSWRAPVLACLYAAALPFLPKWRLPRAYAVLRPARQIAA